MPPPVTPPAGSAQQLTRTAADVEHGRGRHDEREVEAEVAPLLPGAEPVVELGESGFGEQAIDHGSSLPNRPRGHGRIRRVPRSGDPLKGF